MANLEEIEMAVSALSDGEYAQFRRWFLERDWVWIGSHDEYERIIAATP